MGTTYKSKIDIGLTFPIFILLILFSIMSSPVFSQPGNPALETLAGQLHSLARNSPSELAYIQTSKGIYETGEDLWFKAYVLNSQNFIPSALSQTLYLQMVNEKSGKSVWQEKYEIQNGFADGHVFLQDSLSEGDYLLEAYTQYSFFNDSTEFKAIRKITVRKDMNPRPLFTADFNQLFYKTSDTIKVRLTALSEQGKPLYSEVEAILLQRHKKLGQSLATTNEQGKANLVFALQSKGEGLQIDVRVKYANREESYRFSVPCKKGNPVQFDTFPEGGNLVAGLPCNLAFKAVNIDGYPLDVAGTLFEDDSPLLEFKSTHAGMGSLGFIPLAGKKYHIRLTKPTTDSTFLLPEVYPEVATLRLAGRDKEYLTFVVSQSPGLKRVPVYLRGQLRGMVCCMATGLLNKELKIKIPLKEFPGQGIAEFTLFDEKLVPVAERLVYVNPDKNLYIDAKLLKDKFQTREKAVLKIKATDENGQPVRANLGISVYDKLYQNAKDPQNILTHCYLSSQLKGKIYDPAWYFDSRNKGRGEALDLLMLTQGWRRYVWGEENLKTYVEAKQPVIFDGTEGEVHATKKLKKAPEVQQFVMAFNPGENKNPDLIMADSIGRFAITPGHLKTWQGGYVYLKPLGLPDFEPRISLTDPFQVITRIMKYKEITYPQPNSADTAKERAVQSFVAGLNVIELDEVTIKGKAIKPFRDKYMGHLDSIAKYDLCTDYVGTPCNTLNCPFHKNDRSKKPIEGKTYNVVLGKNGEILGPDYPYNYYFGDRTIVYHNANLIFTEEELLKMNNLYRETAYYGKREFYQPNYDKESENEVLSDVRNTLLWAPSVITDENGEVTLEFFCSDINTTFVGKVEGVNGDGLLGTKDFGFDVRKLKPFKWEK